MLTSDRHDIVLFSLVIQENTHKHL